MSAPDSIYKLVEKFTRDKPGSETEVRVQFVDPLFAALGWDLQDKRQVRHEARVIIREAGLERSKRPDYSFQIGNSPDFFVETKMPHVNLERNPIPAFQLRRYGWSGNTPVSVLTDFEEFSVYDCRIQPQRSDPAATARLRYYQYGDYIDKWDELEARFSRKAVAQGALRDWIEGERVRGFSRVDQAFLREMEDWRELLARDIALHNRELSQRQLNLIVQRTIDRIVFLRIAEDRNIEAYGRLRSAAAANKPVYAELKRLFSAADDKYNSGLFHFGAEARASQPDRLSLNIHIPDEPLRHIIKNLYFPFSPYEFSALPADILGQVYERFLGKVIELSASGAVRVEAKPEVRKAGGVYYTPSYIVDYIVENTVGALLKGKTPADAATLRILDPACGSGSFLVGAYQCLLDWHLNYYREHPRQFRNRRRETTDGMMLTTAEKRRILQNNIYGVDLDQNAVEVSKLSLLLKMLENESAAAGAQTLMFAAGGRILPDLSDNIKWGNSLVGSDFFRGSQAGLFDNEEAMLRVKAFDWDSEDGFGAIMAAGGFDAVIGNPPYVDSEWMTLYHPEERAYCTSKYAAASGNWDLFCVFIDKALSLCRDNGISSLIVPNKLGSASYAKGARKVVANENQLQLIRDYSHVPVFPVSVYPIIYIARKTAQRDRPVVYERMQETVGSPIVKEHYELDYQRHFGNPNDTWRVFGRIDEGQILEKIEGTNPRLGEIADVLGAATVSEAYHIKPLIHEAEDYPDYRLRMANSGTIDRFSFLWGQKKFRYIKRQMDRPVIPVQNERALPMRRLQQARTQKVIIAGMTKRLECALDYDGNILAGKSTTIVMSEDFDLKYLVGVLNSDLVDYYYNATFGGNKLSGGYLRIGPPQVKTIPIRTIDFDNPADVAMHDKMVELVDEMLDRHKQLPGLTGEGRKMAERLIATVDGEIDALVYRLYGLSEGEVRVVEG
ncbi:MAG: N-6 DNA methylase [Chloroflexi bacterium]|nr:N-6 DNA methylase [Chloroflexota bacterium]MCY4247811.1 N-6 DNA methylase [Chloroflexota bacterium]